MPDRRSSRTLLVALAVAVAGEASWAPISGQETASEISVLFVGNSLTIWNDLPAMLESLLRSGGLERVRVASLSQPGFGLEDHWRGGIARAAIRTGEWDVIVLQQGPSATEGRPSLLEYSGRFAQEARDAGARVGLYMVWPTHARRNDFEGVSETYTSGRRCLARGLVPESGSRSVRSGRLPSESGRDLPGGARYLWAIDALGSQRSALSAAVGFPGGAALDGR
ncbi:MAG: hypothetical protein P8Y07_09320 [Gemmatimonadales bacterium]